MDIRRFTIHRLPHFLHHFLVALVLASVILILEYHGMLNWLDSVTLRTVATIEVAKSNVDTLSAADAPISLLITDEYFEGSFKQESPLDRRELVRLLRNIIQSRPSLIAIDLDLSPGPVSEPGDEGQEDLDALLIRTVVVEKIPVALTAPYPVVGESLILHKHEWLSRMCASGIRVGYANVVLSQGLALRYLYETPSLGIVASDAGRSLASSKPSDRDLCSYVVAGPEKTAFLSKANAPEESLHSGDFSHQRPMSSDYMRQSSALRQFIGSAEIGNLKSAIAGRPVFLGSQFDARDEFLTPYGLMKGTSIHATTFYSERRPTYAVTHKVALLLDLIFGVAAGYLFGAIWRRTNVAASKWSSNQESLVRWLLARGWLLISFVVLSAWLAMLFYSSAWLLSRDLWNNPGPMIVGVFVKTQLASRVRLHGDPHHAQSGGGIRRTVVRNLDWVCLSPFVFWAATLLLRH